MVDWHHQFNGHEFEQTLGDSEGQRSLACCSPWGCKESDTTQRLNNNNLLKMLVTQLPLILCNPIDCSPPGSSAHGFLQARILKWVAIPFSRGSSQPRDWTQISSTADRFFAIRATTEATSISQTSLIYSFVSQNNI